VDTLHEYFILMRDLCSLGFAAFVTLRTIEGDAPTYEIIAGAILAIQGVKNLISHFKKIEKNPNDIDLKQSAKETI